MYDYYLKYKKRFTEKEWRRTRMVAVVIGASPTPLGGGHGGGVFSPAPCNGISYCIR